MAEFEKETSRKIELRDLRRAEEIEHWFNTRYFKKLCEILRHEYLGIPEKNSRLSLELEAYEKEQELRHIFGEESLPPIKNKRLF